MVDQTPMAQRPPKNPGPWQTAEGRQVLHARDEELVGRVGDLAKAADRLHRALPGTLSVMRDNMAGQPRSSSGQGDGEPARWCEEHEQGTSRCDADGHVCEGVVSTGPSDPVGEAAMAPDRAQRDHDDLIRRLEVAFRTMHEAVSIAASYPTQAAPLEDAEPSPGDEWCRCCWKDGKYCEPVTVRRATGQPYYRGLCRWCGDMAKQLRQEPPTWMVAKRHRGERISPGDIERATKAPASNKPKGKRKRR